MNILAMTRQVIADIATSALRDARRMEALTDRVRESGELPYDVLRCLDVYDPRDVSAVIRDMLSEEILKVDIKNTYSLR